MLVNVKKLSCGGARYITGAAILHDEILKSVNISNVEAIQILTVSTLLYPFTEFTCTQESISGLNELGCTHLQLLLDKRFPLIQVGDVVYLGASENGIPTYTWEMIQIPPMYFTAHRTFDRALSRIGRIIGRMFPQKKYLSNRYNFAILLGNYRSAEKIAGEIKTLLKRDFGIEAGASSPADVLDVLSEAINVEGNLGEMILQT